MYCIVCGTQYCLVRIIFYCVVCGMQYCIFIVLYYVCAQLGAQLYSRGAAIRAVCKEHSPFFSNNGKMSESAMIT